MTKFSRTPVIANKICQSFQPSLLKEAIAVRKLLFFSSTGNVYFSSPVLQCALQWVLRRILAASIDRRQAALLLYGLQIASSNVKQTTFEPYYRKVIRDLPAAETETNETNFSPCHLERAPTEQTRGESKDLVLQPAPPLPSTASTSDEPSSFAQPQPPAPAQLATDNWQLATARPGFPQPSAAPRRPNRPSRRPPGKSLATDNWQLATARPALSHMFQREVRRHLARLDFPNSADADPAES